MDRSTISNYREEFALLAPQFVGADLAWLSQTRQNALDQFDALGFPTTRLEDWKYTNVATLGKHAFVHGGPSATAVDPHHWQSRLFDKADDDDYLVFVNGKYSSSLSRRRPYENGSIVTHLSDALAKHSSDVEAFFNRNAKPFANGFIALNAAWWNDGAYIALPRDVTLDHAIHLIFICTEADRACHVRNLVHADSGSKATVVEHYLGAADATYFTNTITQVEMKHGATVEHYRLQDEGERAFHVAHLDVRQAERSRFDSHAIALGALLSRTDITTCFQGEGCNTTLKGLYVANGRQHVDHHTRIDHAAPCGISREYYKGILDGAARGVFNGKVIVHADAQKSDASQTNRNLLLSDRAEIDTKPQLEIYADDVKCSHGATVGQLDENHVFYLRSRGLDNAAARNVLTYAFAEEVVAQIGIASLRRRVERSLRLKLPLTPFTVMQGNTDEYDQ